MLTDYLALPEVVFFLEYWWQILLLAAVMIAVAWYLSTRRGT